MTDAARARIILRQCERLAADLILRRGWWIAPQLDEHGVISALVHTAGSYTTVLTLPVDRWESDVLGLRGGPSEGSLLCAPIVQWHHRIPMLHALLWARSADDPSNGASLADWLDRHESDPDSP
ncbi:hypothetical protein CU254_42535 (plasmid) [Amycolatopsis sp. AA4]|uniref:hypothetical protein n=1 Tax=Actinomycetes TaxID=1760 RepID=UPI0001B57160|nr:MULTISPECIES: hypothetical protein [Actinomycetes]ATY17265.1 hypothetical protein CU254_42535 [Amycolatopsis sp. AA4]